MNLRRKSCLLVVGFAVLLPFYVLLLFTVSVPDMSAEPTLLQRVAELQVKLQYLDSIYRSRQEEVQMLNQHIHLLNADNNAANNNLNNSSGGGGGSGSSSSDLKSLLMSSSARNSSEFLRAVSIGLQTMIRLPSAYNFLPHLLDDPTSLRPAYLVSRGRTGVSVALGIPTVKREKQSYLIATLKNLVESMSEAEAADALIVVLIAEPDIEYVLQVAKEIETRFPAEVESGLLEVLSPAPSYYPDFDKLKITLGDSPERVKWRSKQNLDFAYLMSYSQPKATFYVQLEDDIFARKNFISSMKNYALEKTARKEPWFVLDFCQLGFIGKMFRSAELPWVIQFLQMFFNDKPVDWLLYHFIATKVCNIEKDYEEKCKKAKAKLWVHYKPSLFQHIGMHSSLKGKVQKLKDKQFGKVALFFPHVNPEAEIFSGIKSYKQFTLERAYRGQTFFWGLLPMPKDVLQFNFVEPITIKRFLFRSGNVEHPSDKFYNTTVELLPVSPQMDPTLLYNATSDGFVVVGKFDSIGIAEGCPDVRIGPAKSLRLQVHSESDNWAILSEILIEDIESPR